MSDFIYRFRPMRTLLGCDELKNQSIFFADPGKLNDPIESYKDVYWKGDQILWKNLIKHYAICVYEVYLRLRIHGDDDVLDEESIPVFLTYQKLPTEVYREKVDIFFKALLASEVVKVLLKEISLREKVRRNELIFYLEGIHPLCISLLQELDETLNKKAEITFKLPPLIESNFFEELKSLENKGKELGQFTDIMFSILNQSKEQLKILAELRGAYSISNNHNFFIFDFPSKYVAKIEHLIFWPWSTACFSRSPNHSSMWGHYADGHSGVCLKFKMIKRNGKLGVNLNTSDVVNPSSKPSFYSFHDISYDKKIKPIDYFRSIGRLSYPDLISNWYSDELNNVSPLVHDILEEQNTWRLEYWDKYFDNISTKTSDWQHEEESRLIKYSTLNDVISEKSRVMHYNFFDLEGIIFGINTSKEDKIKIIKMIRDKCEETKRNDFSFYQASYNDKEGVISHNKLTHITFTF